jgi:hypothetical protein
MSDTNENQQAAESGLPGMTCSPSCLQNWTWNKSANFVSVCDGERLIYEVENADQRDVETAKIIATLPSMMERITQLEKERDEARMLAENWRDHANWRSSPRPDTSDFPWENA